MLLPLPTWRRRPAGNAGEGPEGAEPGNLGEGKQQGVKYRKLWYSALCLSKKQPAFRGRAQAGEKEEQDGRHPHKRRQ